MNVFQRLAVLAGSETNELLEGSIKMTLVAVAAGKRDLQQRQVGIAQQRTGRRDAHAVDVIDEGHACLFFEPAHKGRQAHTGFFRDLL